MRTIHIDVKYKFVKDLVNQNKISISYIESENQIAEIFTKPLKLAVFHKFRKLLGVCTLENLV